MPAKILSPLHMQEFALTYASKRAGGGVRRSTVRQAALGEVSIRIFYLPPLGRLSLTIAFSVHSGSMAVCGQLMGNRIGL